jgi:hypothetical protein
MYDPDFYPDYDDLTKQEQAFEFHLGPSSRYFQDFQEDWLEYRIHSGRAD